MSEEAKWHDWKIVKKLGEGGYGTVYEIMRNRYSIEEHRALKVINIPSDDADAKRLAAEGMSDNNIKAYYRSLVNEFIKEIAFLSELRGTAHIVTYDDYRVVEKKNGCGWEIYIMMELLTPLPDLREKKQPDDKEIRKLGAHICDALSVCHSRNILHRDIKADNIFVTQDGVYKLGDFGIARTVEKTTAAHTRIGTNTYMAPETYRGQKYDTRADIYSLGILLYRMLNNNRIPFLPPYPTPITVFDREEALERRFDGEPLPRPAHGSDDLIDVVLKACAYLPEDRYATAEEMKEALTAAPVRERYPAVPAAVPYSGTDAAYSPSYPPRQPYREPYREPASPVRPQRQNYYEDYDEDDDEDTEEKGSSGINAAVAVVIVLIVLVLIGGGVTIYALLNRNAGSGNKTTPSETAFTSSAAQEEATRTEPVTVAVTMELPYYITSSVKMEYYLDGQESQKKEVTLNPAVGEQTQTFYPEISGDRTLTVFLDGSLYYSCRIDYESAAVTEEVYNDNFYSPNVAD